MVCTRCNKGNKAVNGRYVDAAGSQRELSCHRLAGGASADAGGGGWLAG